MTGITGGCQCGATRYAVSSAPLRVLACHCTDCQRQSGSAFALVMVVEEGAFTLTKGELRSFDGLSEAGRAKSGSFCPECGCRIYNQVAVRLGTLSIRAGTLDDTGGLEPEMHIWTRSSQPWVTIPEGTPCHETQG